MILTILLVSTVLLFSGCGPKNQIAYVYRDCPRLQTYEVEAEMRDLNIDYTVKYKTSSKEI